MEKVRRAITSNKMLKDNGILFAGSMLAAGLNYLFYPVLGRFLSPSEFGEVQVLATLVVQSALVFGLARIAIMSEVANAASDAESKRLFKFSERLLLQLALIMTVLAIATAPLIAHVLHYSSVLPLYILIPTLVLNGMRSSRDAYARVAGRFGLASLTDISASLIKLIFAASLAAIGLGTIGATFGLLAAYVASAVTVVYVTSRMGVQSGPSTPHASHSGLDPVPSSARHSGLSPASTTARHPGLDPGSSNKNSLFTRFRLGGRNDGEVAGARGRNDVGRSQNDGAVVGAGGEQGVRLQLKGLLNFEELRSLFRRGAVTKRGAVTLSVSAASLVIVVLSTMHTVIAKASLSPNQAGLFAGISVIATIVFFATGSIAGVLLASTRPTRPRAQNVHGYVQSALLMGGLSATIAVLFYLFPHATIQLLLGAKYLTASTLLPTLTIAMLAMAGSNLIISYHIAMRDKFILPIALVVGSIVTGTLLLWHASASQLASSFMGGNIIAFVLALGWTVYWHRRVYTSEPAVN